MTAPICIIGAGPAGAIASMVLSNAQVPHLLIDRSVFPRDKVCGECFDGRVVHVLQRVNEPLLQRMRSQGVLRNNWFHHAQYLPYKWAGATLISPDLKPRPAARRIDFDNALFQEAKSSPFCESMEGAFIANIERKESGEWHITLKDGLSINTRLILLCAGANTSLLRYFQFEGKESNRLLFSQGFYKNVMPAAQEPSMELFSVQSPLKGFVYINRHSGDVANVELAVYESDYKGQQMNLQKALPAAIAGSPFLAERFQEASLVGKMSGTSMFLNASKSQYAAAGVMLAGASAYCLHPATGMGVGNAMKMGEIAGHHAVACFQQQDYSGPALKSYDDAVRKLRRSTHKTDIFFRFMSWLCLSITPRRA